MNAEETKFFTLPVGKGKDRRLQIVGRKEPDSMSRRRLMYPVGGRPTRVKVRAL
jgi:hypothetical protein